jgi:replicative DNA helicase
MIENEKAILATVLEYPEYTSFLLENCDDGFFTGIHNETIFQVIKGIYEEKSLIDWATIKDIAGIKGVESSYFLSMNEYLRGLHPLGAERFLKEKISFLKRYRAKERLGSLINEERTMPEPDFKRIREICDQAEVVVLTPEKTDFQSAYSEYLQQLKQEETGIFLGIPSIDRWVGCYNSGELITIMARTTVGKSMFAIKVLMELPEKMLSQTGFFSLEMGKPMFIERMLQQHFGLWREDIRGQVESGFLDEGEFKKKFKTLRIYNRIYSITEISRIIERDNLKVVFIDFLQLLKAGEGNNSYEKTSSNMRLVKELAMNQKIVVFLLSQLSRRAGSGEQAVSLDTARESGQIEELSDFVVGIWRPELEGNQVCLALLKNKRGPTISVKCTFDKKSGKIYEVEKDNHE